ncbi:MAG: RraA family protein, partial [Deltaproteobacteria bacterium]|nr:RraA family protein [Deltaproteobacteria bacterium]
AIVDGGVRDVLAIQEMKFPLFYTNPVVTSAQPRLETVAVNEPVDCGGRIVRPGDLVVADYDGVVVVPRDAIEKIYPLCLEYAEKEKAQREALESGTPLTDLVKGIL